MNTRVASRILYYIGLVIIAIVSALPLYYLVITTFKTPEEAAISPLGLPKSWSFVNYSNALEKMNFTQAVTNNLIITVFSVILLILFSSMAAYVIARSPKKIYNIMFSIFLVGLIIPFQVAIVPLYSIISALGVMNTHLGVIIISVFCINMPLSIFLLRGFISTVPVELEEAAYIDGAGTFKTFWVIVFPLLKPIVVTLVILNTLAIWNDFLTPLLFLQSPEKAVLLQEVYKNVGPFSTNWTSFFPMLVMSVLPLVIFYLVLQRRVMEGVVTGAVKG